MEPPRRDMVAPVIFLILNVRPPREFNHQHFYQSPSYQGEIGNIHLFLLVTINPSAVLPNTVASLQSRSRTFDTMSIQKLPAVLITGCTDGSIGHGLVLSFSRRGYHVFATARRLSAMSTLKALPNITLLELDVTSPESI